MSTSLLTQLETGLEKMALDLPESVPAQLIEYLELLVKWNKAFNLTAVRDPSEMVSKHLLDSLVVLPYIGNGLIADVGSGAGLPGIPLALARPETRFVLLDSNGKKTSFLIQAKRLLKLDNVEVVNQRVEDYRPELYFDAVIARAYADTDLILKSTAHLHQPETRILVMQGKLDETINDPAYVLKQAHTLDVYGLDAERHLLEIIKANS
ncbi:MAG: 16S rRNA (guanine(527)-N(7))-methyltransferase RsmG [Gammaproteobacteria bacterium]|nr:16S rRNA (guanine(527)-N(7))-methyltransferase RsmG [Gammaproteobacteria bacterium]